MAFRTFILLLAVMFTAAACSHGNEGDEGQIQVQQGQDGMGGPLDGTQVTDGSMNNGVIPGSQQDLVVNVGDRVFFAYDSSDLSPEGQATLNKQAEWLNQYPNVNVTISGHCDERGTREYNLALGERRAASAKNYLVSLGVSSSRINTISYGKERPAVMGSDAESWAQNRRAVTEVN